MPDFESGGAQLTAVIQITRKETGLTETYTLRMRPMEEVEPPPPATPDPTEDQAS